MIFVTVGSHEPFDRLIAVTDQLAKAYPDRQFYGQITARAGYTPTSFPYAAELEAKEYDDACQRATCLVAHAGMGSIITALELRKPIVVLPRRAHLGETRNDHQFDTAMKFKGKPGIFVAECEDDVPAALEAALAWTPNGDGGTLSAFAEDRLIAFLKDAIA